MNFVMAKKVFLYTSYLPYEKIFKKMIRTSFPEIEILSLGCHFLLNCLQQHKEVDVVVFSCDPFADRGLNLAKRIRDTGYRGGLAYLTKDVRRESKNLFIKVAGENGHFLRLPVSLNHFSSALGTTTFSS